MIRRFRIYPSKGSRLFVRVVVYPTGDDMLEAIAGENFAPQPPEANDPKPAATTREWMVWRVYPNGKQRRNACVAEVRLRTDRLSAEVLSHEAFHAAMAWGRRTRFHFERLSIDPVNGDEEKLAYIHSNLCQATVDRLTAMGLYK